jgi:hypothetical protein
VELLRSPQPHDLTFAAEDHVHWQDAAGDLHFGGWQAGHEHLGLGSHWAVSPRGVTAFSGHLWKDTKPWEAGRSWSEQLAREVEPVTAARAARDLDGVFGLVCLDPAGHGCVTADPLGVGLVYRADTPDVTVLSNRAALAARLAAPEGSRPGRDLEGAGWLAYANNLQTDRTTFEGVRTIDQASAVEFRPGQEPATTRWSDAPWLDPAGAPGGPSDQADAIASAVDHLRALVRAFAALPSAGRTLELTGGRDSRMILALLLAEDLARDFVYVTWGPPTLPDVVVAGELADRFGLDLRANGRPRTGGMGTRAAAGAAVATPSMSAPATATAGPSAASTGPPLSYEDLLRRHVWRTSGASSVWDLSIQTRVPSPAFVLTGQFGELLRTNYPHTTAIRSVRDLPAYVRTGAIGFDAAGLLRPEARAHYDGLVLDQLDALRPPGGTAQDAIDAHNQVARLRRWFGTSHELDNRNRLFPLYSMPATRAAFAMGSRRRRAEELPFEILLATCPELATLRFAGSAWPADLMTGRPDAGRYPTSPVDPPWRAPGPLRRARRRWVRRRPPAPGSAKVGTAVEADRMADLQAKIPVLRSFLDLGRDHRLYEILDHDRTLQAVGRLADHGFLARRAIHDAVTAAMWLEGAEQREVFGP